MQTDGRTHRQEDREQYRQLFKDIVGGRLLSGKESWSTERKSKTVQIVRDLEADGRDGYGQESRQADR